MIILKTLIELAAVVLLIYGFCHEKQVIGWEQKQKIKLLRFILGVMK